MKEIRTEIEIEASPEYVWGMLTDFNEYPKWNLLIHSTGRDIKLGAQVEAPIGFYDVSTMPVPMKVIEVLPNRMLRLRRQFLFSGLFDREYIFTIEAISSNRVRLIQQKISSGLLAPLLAHRGNDESRNGLEQLSQTIKILAEQQRFSSAFG